MDNYQIKEAVKSMKNSKIASFAMALAILSVMVFIPSCAKKKADVTVHYEITNTSGIELKIESAYRTFELPDGGTESFTDVSEGEDYYGSCWFENVFEPGYTLVVTYGGKDYRMDNPENFGVGLDNFNRYNIDRTAPREFTAIYKFIRSDLTYFLYTQGVEIDDIYYTDYSY